MVSPCAQQVERRHALCRPASAAAGISPFLPACALVRYLPQMWGLTHLCDTRYSFWRSLQPLRKAVKAADGQAEDDDGFDAFSLSPGPLAGAGPKDTTTLFHRPDGTYVVAGYAQRANRGWKTAVENPWLCRSALLVLLQGGGEPGAQVDAQLVGKHDHDEEHITELISN
jgi:hypothetical protein